MAKKTTKKTTAKSSPKGNMPMNGKPGMMMELMIKGKKKKSC